MIKQWNLLTACIEWQVKPLKQTILPIAAQVSARIFLGPELCRNPEWLSVAIGYTINASMAGKALRLYPKFMVPLVHNYVPAMRRARNDINKARQLIGPILQKRRQDFIDARASGNNYAKRSLDTVAWMEEMSGGIPYDAAAAQLSLSFLANHTTSDHMSQCLIDLCRHPELIEPLRDEIITVLREHGWKKSTFHHLKLMDSFFKESQRFKPLAKSERFLFH
jgi:cytochrome P450